MFLITKYMEEFMHIKEKIRRVYVYSRSNLLCTVSLCSMKYLYLCVKFITSPHTPYSANCGQIELFM